MSIAGPLRISQSARRLRIFVFVLMAGLAAAIALQWLGPAARVRVEMHAQTPGLDPRIAGSITIALLELALFELTRMLGVVVSGEYFSYRAVAHFRGFAGWLLFLAVLGLVAPMLNVNRDGGVDVHFIVINLGTLMIFGVTLVLFLLARLLERAGEIEQENREIV